MGRKLTLLYQNPTTPLREWYAEIFSPWIDRVVDDGTHTIVLDNCIVADVFVQQEDPAYYRKFLGKNAFLLLAPDEYYATPPATFRNFCGVVRSHHSSVFLADRVLQIPTGYNPGFGGPQTFDPASRRQYMWSFLGQVNKTTRPECLRSLLHLEPNLWYASDGWKPAPNWTGDTGSFRPRQAYLEILRDSAFAPSPMGNVSQEALRPFEALQVGSIPILEKRWLMDAHRAVLGDDHPLPTFYSWKEAAQFMSRLWANPSELDALQQRCLTWWADYKLRLSGEVGAFLSRLEDQHPTASTRYVAPWAHIPGWSLAELARHHTPRALARRVERNTKRLLTTGRLLVHK